MFTKKILLWILGVVVVLGLVYLGFVYFQGNKSGTNPPSNTGQNANNGTPNNGNNASNNGTTNNPGNTSTQPTDEQKQFINTIVSLAKQGKVINCDFVAGDTNIEKVEKVWGNPDTRDYVKDAKGTYSTYTKHGVVFGYNKGARIFEVRSFDSKVKALTLKEVKQVLGTPPYDKIISGNQHIIGYAVNSTFKLEFVFPKETATQPNPSLDHMNVLDPTGTVNSMAGDPGRQW